MNARTGILALTPPLIFIWIKHLVYDGISSNLNYETARKDRFWGEQAVCSPLKFRFAGNNPLKIMAGQNQGTSRHSTSHVPFRCNIRLLAISGHKMIRYCSASRQKSKRKGRPKYHPHPYHECFLDLHVIFAIINLAPAANRSRHSFTPAGSAYFPLTAFNPKLLSTSPPNSTLAFNSPAASMIS